MCRKYSGISVARPSLQGSAKISLADQRLGHPGKREIQVAIVIVHNYMVLFVCR